MFEVSPVRPCGVPERAPAQTGRPRILLGPARRQQKWKRPRLHAAGVVSCASPLGDHRKESNWRAGHRRRSTPRTTGLDCTEVERQRIDRWEAMLDGAHAGARSGQGSCSNSGRGCRGNPDPRSTARELPPFIRTSLESAPSAADADARVHSSRCLASRRAAATRLLPNVRLLIGAAGWRTRPRALHSSGHQQRACGPMTSNRLRRSRRCFSPSVP